MEEEKAPKENKKSQKLDIETYCDVKGIHDGDRFAYMIQYKNTSPMDLDSWDQLIKNS